MAMDFLFSFFGYMRLSAKAAAWWLLFLIFASVGELQLAESHSDMF